MSDNFFYANVCHVCKKFSDSLKKCSQCKLVSYCCVEHQKSNWPVHRQLCRAVGAVVRRFDVKSVFSLASDDFDWIKARSSAMLRTEIELERDLTAAERQMFWFPSVCAVCRSSCIKQQLICRECFCFSYCCEDHLNQHRQEHESVCREFNLCFKLDCMMAAEDFCHSRVEISTKRQNDYFPSDINEFIYNYIKSNGSDYFTILTSEILTCTATVIYAVEIEQILDQHCGRLNIVLLGPEMSGPERGFVECLNVLSHWFRGICEINVSFVGPSVHPFPVRPPQSCESIRLFYHNQLYHDYVKSSHFIAPDLIFAFHCGFHESQILDSDPWKDTIPLLYESRKLVVFTSYSLEEADKDYTRFILLKPPEKQVRVSTQGSVNPFRSLRPHRDWETQSVYYQNYYISVINTSSSDTGVS